ncbi:MAG: hypothetical protein AB4050_02600 [Synechococcus sp.]
MEIWNYFSSLILGVWVRDRKHLGDVKRYGQNAMQQTEHRANANKKGNPVAAYPNHSR